MVPDFLLVHTIAVTFYITPFTIPALSIIEKCRVFGGVLRMAIIASPEKCIQRYEVEDRPLMFLKLVLVCPYLNFIAIRISIPPF